MRGTVSVRKIESILRVAERRGVARAELLARIGVQPSDLQDGEAQLGLGVWRDLWNVVVEVLDDPGVGLDAGRQIDRGYFGVIDYIVRSSATVGDALAQGGRFFPLANTQGRLRLVRTESSLVVERHLAGDESLVLPPQAAEFALAAMVQLFRDAAASPWSLERVTFRHAEPADPSSHRALFRCPVEFGAACDSLAVGVCVLATPMGDPDPHLHRLIATHGERLLADLPPSSNVVDDVRRILVHELPGVRNGSDQVASLLGTSRRSLHRRLKEAGTSFREVRDGLRRELARRYLADDRFNVAEIAMLLGYADASAFHRAFRAWFNEAPAHYRRRAGG